MSGFSSHFITTKCPFLPIPPFLLLLHSLTTVKKVTLDLVCLCSLGLVYLFIGCLFFGLVWFFCLTSLFKDCIIYIWLGVWCLGFDFVCCFFFFQNNAGVSLSYEDEILLLHLGTLYCCKASTYILKIKTYNLKSGFFFLSFSPRRTEE